MGRLVGKARLILFLVQGLDPVPVLVPPQAPCPFEQALFFVFPLDLLVRLLPIVSIRLRPCMFPAIFDPRGGHCRLQLC